MALTVFIWLFLLNSPLALSKTALHHMFQNESQDEIGLFFYNEEILKLKAEACVVLDTGGDENKKLLFIHHYSEDSDKLHAGMTFPLAQENHHRIRNNIPLEEVLLGLPEGTSDKEIYLERLHYQSLIVDSEQVDNPECPLES